jgi:hypothetical protein
LIILQIKTLKKQPSLNIIPSQKLDQTKQHKFQDSLRLMVLPKYVLNIAVKKLVLELPDPTAAVPAAGATAKE